MEERIKERGGRKPGDGNYVAFLATQECGSQDESSPLSGIPHLEL